jgi:hypothetical protein
MAKRVLDQMSARWDHLAPGDVAAVTRDCALMLGGIVDGATQAGCKIDLSAEAKQQIEAARARRTVVPPTGVEAVDQVLAAMAALRDQACDCADRACARAARQAFDALPPGTLAQAPQAARDAAGDLAEELADCTSDARVYP